MRFASKGFQRGSTKFWFEMPIEGELLDSFEDIFFTYENFGVNCCLCHQHNIEWSSNTIISQSFKRSNGFREVHRVGDDKLYKNLGSLPFLTVWWTNVNQYQENEDECKLLQCKLLRYLTALNWFPCVVARSNRETSMLAYDIYDIWRLTEIIVDWYRIWCTHPAYPVLSARWQYVVKPVYHAAVDLKQ